MQPLLLISYGAPERREEVVPFLHNLFSGKQVSADRLTAAVHKYEQYATQTGHYSPLNSECRRLIDGIQHEWSRCHHEPLPIYWGNLFWHPLLTDTVAEMARAGIERAFCFATSAFDSPPGNQRYADALESARQNIGTDAPMLEKLPLPFEHPLFIEAQTDRLLETLAWHNLAGTPIHILFSAHSIPLVDSSRCRYVEQLRWTCREIIEKSGTPFSWELVFQSRSGAAAHWLGPDIRERIRELAVQGDCQSVIVSPLGFFCENMETEYDLDVEVGECCAEVGISFFRVRAVGAMQKICRLLVKLVSSRCQLCR